MTDRTKETRAWFTTDEINAWAEKKLKENPQWTHDYNTEAVLVEEMQRMAKRIEELEAEREQVQYKYGPMAFQIYLPKYPTPAVNNANLPWVYDQDRSSGNVASMWVTPVARIEANRQEKNAG